MKIAIGSDHCGFNHKEFIKKEFSSIEWLDVGAYDTNRSDYPVFSTAVCELIRSGKAQAGVLICGSGIGMSIAANRFSSIYAGLVWNEDIARVSKEDDNINVIVLPSDFISPEMAVKCIAAWQSAVFKGGRYQERIRMIDEIK